MTLPSLFTRIINREIPAEFVYEDEHVAAFKDIAPKAPVHVLIVTKQEIPGLAELPESGPHTRILNAAKVIAEQLGLEGGYRLVINQGPDAGQTVEHLHAHLLGGMRMTGEFA